MLSLNELEKILKDNKKVLALDTLSKAELSEMLGESFGRMKSYDHCNVHHCYDLLNHSLYTVIAIEQGNKSESDFLKLRLSALFHDIGKPDVATEKYGGKVFYGHAQKSAELADTIFRDLGYSEKNRTYLYFFIRYHDVFISFKRKNEIPENPNPYIKEINPENVSGRIEQVVQEMKEKFDFIPTKQDFLLLMELCCADCLAQSETVIINGNITDTRQNKVDRYLAVKQIIEIL